MNLGDSTFYGKSLIRDFLLSHFNPESLILDVGAGKGTYKQLLGEDYRNIDAVEVWPEAVSLLTQTYNNVYQIDIRDFKYPKNYDLIIFGDILEHLTVADAKKVLNEAEKHSKHILIGVPYNYKQGVLYGNELERHLQDDLTFEIFKIRYPGYKFLFGRFDFYGYYYK